MICITCSSEVEQNGAATQVFRRNGVVVTVTGIPAVAVCPSCGNAVLDWDVAQEVEDLIQEVVGQARSLTLDMASASGSQPDLR
jgi:YgiT-type zinc finger domain-containing protein